MQQSDDDDDEDDDNYSPVKPSRRNIVNTSKCALSVHQGQEERQQRNGAKPPPMLTRIMNGVESQYNYMNTVHSLQELDTLRSEHQCSFPNKRKIANNSFNFLQLRCKKVRNPANGNSGCPFALLVWRPESDRKQIHVYVTSGTKHNHQIELAAPYGVPWPDEREPEKSFIAKSRKWSFLETAMNVDELNVIRRDKFHCGCGKIKTGKGRFTMQCMNSNVREGCAFKLVAQRTDRGRFHLYGSEEHTCSYKNYQLVKVVQQLSAANPPASFATPADGRQWHFLETLQIEMGKKLVKKLRLIGRKYNCGCGHVKELRRRRTLQKEQMYCTSSRRGSSKCPFRLLLQHTDRAGCYQLYASGQHTCIHSKNTAATTNEEGDNNNLMSSDEEEEIRASNLLQNDGKPPPVFTRINTNKGVKCRYNYLKTVYSVQELDKCRIEHQCVLQNMGPGFKHARLHCQKINSKKCPFALLAWRPEPESAEIHVYTTQNEQHNHVVKPADKRVMYYKMPKKELVPDANPPANFSTPNGREWSFLETADTPTELERIQKRKYHCFLGTLKELNEGKCRKTIYCLNKDLKSKNSEPCRFALVAQRTDQGRFHLYGSDKHTCSYYKGTKEDTTLFCWRELLPDAHPPASFVTQNNGLEWTFLETVGMEEKLTDQLDRFKRKYHCIYSVKNVAMRLEDWRRSICRMTFRCTVYHKMCPFRVLAQKTDQGRLHVYGSGKHTCMHKDKRMGKGMEKESGEEEEEEDDEGDDEKEEEFEDEDGEEEEESNEEEEEEGDDEEEEEEEESDEEEEKENNAEMNDGEMDDEEEKLNEDDELDEEEFDYNAEEDELNENLNKNEEDEEYTDGDIEEEEEGEEDDDEDDEEKAKEDEEIEEEEDNGADNNKEVVTFANVLRSRSPTVPHEIDDVQFVDFVDHPKSEGVKMRRLGEPKDEHGADAPVITMDEEEPIWRRLEIPKREFVKGEAPEEEEPGASNRGGRGEWQSQRAANGTTAATLPMAAINRQNQQQQPMALARERWWAKEYSGAEKAPNNDGQQRLLRERKRRVNYRE